MPYHSSYVALRKWSWPAETDEEKVGSFLGFGRNLTNGSSIGAKARAAVSFAWPTSRDVQRIDRELAARRTRHVKELRPVISPWRSGSATSRMRDARCGKGLEAAGRATSKEISTLRQNAASVLSSEIRGLPIICDRTTLHLARVENG